MTDGLAPGDIAKWSLPFGFYSRRPQGGTMLTLERKRELLTELKGIAANGDASGAIAGIVSEILSSMPPGEHADAVDRELEGLQRRLREREDAPRDDRVHLGAGKAQD